MAGEISISMQAFSRPKTNDEKTNNGMVSGFHTSVNVYVIHDCGVT